MYSYNHKKYDLKTLYKVSETVLPFTTVADRLGKGWTVEDALFQPFNAVRKGSDRRMSNITLMNKFKGYEFEVIDKDDSDLIKIILNDKNRDKKMSTHIRKTHDSTSIEAAKENLFKRYMAENDIVW